MELSIIIPVYNVGEMLIRCTDSVLSQDFADWEMLLIDDGSTDNSGEIADEIGKKDSRIHVFHKTNGGLSDARNYGIECCKGSVVMFIDSDDKIESGTLQALMHIMDNHPECDILEFPVSVHDGHPSEKKLCLPDHKWKSAREYWHNTSAWEHCYAWNKIYRRHTLNNNTFPKGKIFEDSWAWPQVLKKNPTIMTTSEGLYRYIWNTNGITVNAKAKELTQLLHAQIRAAFIMRTTPFSKNGIHLYHSMACRFYDVIRLTLKEKIC